MHIGFDAKRFFHNRTGLGNYSRDTVRMLAEAYPAIKLLLFNPKHEVQSKYGVPSFTTASNLKEINPNTGFYKKLFSLWRIGPITKQIKENNIDIYHGLSNELPIGIQKLNIKSVVTIHDLIFMRFPGWYKYVDRIIYKIKFRYACQVADKIIAISQQTKDDIIKYFDIEPSKIKVVYQGCHPLFQHAFSSSHLDDIRQKYNLPNQFILNVGTIEERKNLLNLVKAIQPLDDIHLVIVGKEKPYAKQVFEYIRSHNMENRVLHLKGISMEALVAVYQCANLFVYPSIFEGFGIPIIEALFSKVPVITSTGSCFEEAGGPDSVYVSHENVNDLRTAIKSVYLNPEITERMKSRGYKYAQKFKDSAITAQLFQLYKGMISN